MQVFRVEHAESGKGPYHFFFIKHWVVGDHSPNSGHPSWNAEMSENYNLRDVEEDDFFGFSSLKQLKQWFRNPVERQNLDGMGFVIRLFETSNFCIGSHQLIFKKGLAEEISTTLSLLEI